MNDRETAYVLTQVNRELVDERDKLEAERDALLSTVAARELDCVRLEGEREVWHLRADEHAKRAHNEYVRASRYREAVELLREAKHALYVADVIGTLPRDIDAFLAGEGA